MQQPLKKSGTKSLKPLIEATILIIIIVTSVTLFYYLILPDNEKPIWKKYDKIDGENLTVFKNDKLNVQIVRWVYEGDIYYKAEWTNIDGNGAYCYYVKSKSVLLNLVIGRSEEMLTNQLKWFEYMLKEVIQ